MNVKKAPIIIAIICFLLACVSLFIIFFVPSVIKTYYDETNTVEHSAIIVNVETNNEECEIFVEEFSCSLKIKTAEIINESYLLELDNGTEIIFRIPENFEQFLYDSDVNSLRIVAVKTNNANIVTLESHNALEQKSNNIIRITGIIFATIFLVITLISLNSVFKRR